MAHPCESIIQGLNEAVEYQQAKIAARETRLTIRPVMEFDIAAIRKIRKKTGLSQVMFALSLGVSPKMVETWECGRNRPEGASRWLLELVNESPDFLVRFQQGKNRYENCNRAHE
jgi:putative transcriptional regulator